MNRLDTEKARRRAKKVFKDKNSKHFAQLLHLTAKFQFEQQALLTVKHSRWFLAHVWIRRKELKKQFKKFNGLWMDYAAEHNQRFTLFEEFVKAKGYV